jgi:predicted RNA polymerase sigma factor
VTDSTHRVLDAVVRAEGSRVLATLVRTIGDLQLAEDAVQEAAVAALRTWPMTGIPDDPRAWLTVAARRKAVDVLRGNRIARARKQPRWTSAPPATTRCQTASSVTTCSG